MFSHDNSDWVGEALTYNSSFVGAVIIFWSLFFYEFTHVRVLEFIIAKSFRLNIILIAKCGGE